MDVENKNLSGKQHKAFSYKNWTPSWIGHTDFGRTLFVTDYLIGKWCWSPETFKVGLPSKTFTPHTSKIAHSLIENIRLTGGRSAGGNSSLVMLQPDRAFVTPQAPKDGKKVYRLNEASVSIKQMLMKVYGSYTHFDGKKENRRLHEEDPNFAQGRTVKKLTKKYNDIALLDPRFDRAKKLMGLLYLHLQLQVMFSHE